MRALSDGDVDAVGLDVRPSEWTHVVGSVADARLVREVMSGVDVVVHAATLHKPQVAFLPRQAFVDTNVTGTLALLEAATGAGVGAFVMTSSTTVFGDALIPAPGEPAAWVDETVVSVPKNIYGVTKAAAEDLCQLAHRNDGLNCVVLRTSRFFPESDDAPDTQEGRSDENVKADEYAYRRVALEDVVSAHLLAAQRAAEIGFARYVISATTPFLEDDLAELRTDAAAVFARRAPRAAAVWAERGLALPEPAGSRVRQYQSQSGVGLAAGVRHRCGRDDGDARWFGAHSPVTGDRFKGVRGQFVSPRPVRTAGWLDFRQVSDSQQDCAPRPLRHARRLGGRAPACRIALGPVHRREVRHRRGGRVA